MTETLTRTRLLVALVAISTIVLVLIAAGGAVPPLSSDDASDSDPESDRPEDPTTHGTIGYVEGYWADDELPVDDRDDAAVADENLEPVVYRSMARVEEIRNMTFDEPVSVDVITREEFRNDHNDVFVELTDDERTMQNVTYEALFMVDEDTDATAELEATYGGTVEGYYQPSTDRIVLVSNEPETPQVDEFVLGHELVHALQDQRFNLSNYGGRTIDRENAENGLIEGDAVAVETEYEQRCGEEWRCLSPDGSTPEQPPDLNWGIYLTLFHPYSDGPDYVDYLRDADGGWTAVTDAYDDPPSSSATVIHHEERPPADIEVPDRSDDSWERLAVDGEVRTQTAGEAAMVAMFGAGALDQSQPSVIDTQSLLGDDARGFDYEQPYTDGWAGDRLVAYVNGDAAEPNETGYVWQTEWRSDADARQFVTGYLEQLEIHGAEPVEDRRDTYVIDDGFAGAYYLERDGTTVTVVHAPSVDELDAIADGAAPEGADTLEADADVTAAGSTTERTSDDGTGDGDGGGESDESDPIPGFAVPGTVIGVSVGLFVARRAGSARDSGAGGARRAG